MQYCPFCKRQVKLKRNFPLMFILLAIVIFYAATYIDTDILRWILCFGAIIAVIARLVQFVFGDLNTCPICGASALDMKKNIKAQ